MKNQQLTIETIGKLKEKLEKKTHEEISLRSENLHLNQVIHKLEQRLKIVEREKQALKNEAQLSSTKLDELQHQFKLEASIIEEWKEQQSELSDYKQRTFDLLEEQKETLAYFENNNERTEKEYYKLKQELSEKEVALKNSQNQYQKIKNSKLMKWTGKYWKLRKKLQLKNK